ncbi:hypothetical protein [Spirillospora sp. NPDC047279]|uniref:hypothetical protein n=1 Tax=Spirillospora sp. NPDC047279 TaxID=3155478 RepID=UPI0033E9ABC0
MSRREERLRAVLTAEAGRHRPDRRRIRARLLDRIIAVRAGGSATGGGSAPAPGGAVGKKAPKKLGIAATFRGRRED